MMLEAALLTPFALIWTALGAYSVDAALRRRVAFAGALRDVGA